MFEVLSRHLRFLIMIPILVLFLALLLFYWKRQERKHFNELADKLPGPPAWPILGNGLSISKHPKGVLHYMIQASKEYGTVTKHSIGKNVYVFLTNPNDIEILLKDSKNIRKSKNYEFLKPWLGSGLVTSTGGHWHHHRKSLTPAFHFSILGKFVEVFNEKGKVLVSKLSKHAEGEVFDIFPYITLYTLDAILETSMGQKVNIQGATKSEYAMALIRLREIIHLRIYNPILWPNCLFWLTKLGREQNKLLNYINRYCRKVIEKRKQELEEIDMEKLNNVYDIGRKNKLAFLDLLLVGQKLGSGLNENDLVDEVNTFLCAGQDTTASAATFAIFNLAKHQDKQQRVYEEIIELFGNGHSELTMTDLQRTQYLDMFVKESMRVFSTIPYISRLLETDLQLTKYTIPAGTSLISFNYMVHRNEKSFPDPENFDPERFSPENSHNRHSFSFLPFSAGPRNCIGQKYAMLEIKSILIHILKHFKILYAEDIQDLQNFIVLVPVGGVKIRLEKRIDNIALHTDNYL